MPTNPSTSPDPAELELSVFGPGNGEAIVLHLGNNQWIIVDSCFDPQSADEPVPLRYLRSICVDVKTSVRLVVATHWHDDHIRGISDVLNACESAKFVTSLAMSTDNFLKLVAHYSQAFPTEDSGLDEFIKVFRTLEARKPPKARLNAPEFAASNKLLDHVQLDISGQAVSADVFSLSPSNSALARATAAFSALLPVPNMPKKRVPDLPPNDSSIVLWVQVGRHRLLLGADLERTVDPTTGWTQVINGSLVDVGPAKVFKVPHHGAESAHEPEVWRRFLSADPLAVLTPFVEGDVMLPTQEDAIRITALTRNAYITALPRSTPYRPADRVVRETARQATRSFRSIRFSSGQIRLRCGVADGANPWRVETIGQAQALPA